ncbi:hypothetical protein TVAG_229860 [Trichomonas vaginalis G3]|uniref:Uncharacterized protein n=1 Tax=Trichomonas vaginalis (strain ATCC PRA-98 / G3) TaxID=412133 RepID=A2G106_TRIV3|nr:hypothetical protein TVAGG3_1043330 [Trichomonas vaginalis G3]EAX89164.1 hypothetical protein TVAG_229860 [Trichomonas vaginalis G3]KAI5493692.1 hypothetical protein TVAGG3_1043330 [Trichomonas vaginalis G3]|eukprot:XP_001302094.1 hypothetical protein [Trichomonas vaginalis G3]
MSSVFQSFTADEVESIKSVFMIGQQSNDMLLKNCSRRPLAEIRAFIKRFKKYLTDGTTSSEEIAKMANQQYVAIITMARAKRNIHQQTMSSAHSMTNLSLPFTNPQDSLPLKFRTKFSRLDADKETPPQKPLLTTRSRSVANGLGSELLPNKTRIDVIPPIDINFPHACRSPDEIIPGDLAAVLKSKSGPTIICRVIALKEFDSKPHALVAFFLQDFKPCWVPLHHLVMLKHEADTDLEKKEEDLTVDTILKKIMVRAQSIVLANNDFDEPEAGNITQQQQSKNILFQALACAAQLQLISFGATWEIPDEKFQKIMREVNKLSQPRFKSTSEVNARCMELIEKILAYIH